MPNNTRRNRPVIGSDRVTFTRNILDETVRGVVEDGPSEPEFLMLDPVDPVETFSENFRVVFSDTPSWTRGLDLSSQQIESISSTINKYKKLHETDFKIEYKDDDLVSTMDGIKAKYKDCIYLHNSFFLKTDPNLVKDYFTGNLIYKLKSATLYPYFKDNILDINRIEYFQFDMLPNGRYDFKGTVLIYDPKSGEYRTIYDNIPKDTYVECFKIGCFYHINDKKHALTDKKAKNMFRKVKNTFKVRPDTDLKTQYLMGVKSPTYQKTENKKYTYGIELETVNGKLPEYVDSFLNYDCVRDGSLKDENGEEWGGEYVTGVLVGDKGLLQSKRMCNELTKRCTVDKRTGMHIHLGDIDFTPELVVYLYKLFLMVEDEIFGMMPLSRRKNEYCKRLKWFDFKFKESDFNNPNSYNSLIKDYYLSIYKFVSSSNKDDMPSSISNKKTQHPLGAKCGYNHSTARYCWINLVPTLFDTRGNGVYTVKFLPL